MQFLETNKIHLGRSEDLMTQIEPSSVALSFWSPPYFVGKEYEKDETPTNLTWSEGDRWYGWTYNNNAKRYYFDDIGNESLMGLWEDQWAREKERGE